MAAFPFPKNTVCDFIQRHIVQKINTSDFIFELPKLSDAAWSSICNNSAERDRLEFVGDALIGSAVSEELYRIRVHGSPGFYTNARAALTANSTFAHLMHRLGYHDIRDAVKPAGDAFETIIAAFRNETSAEAFQQWIRDNFTQLIHAAGAAYDSWMHLSKRRSKGSGGDLKQRRLLDKAKHHQNAEKHPIKKTQEHRHSRTPIRPSASQRESRASAAPHVAIIDLTVDDDWDDEDETMEVEAMLSDPIALDPSLRSPREGSAISAKQGLQSIARSSTIASSSRIRRRNSGLTHPMSILSLTSALQSPTFGQCLMLGSAKDPIIID